MKILITGGTGLVGQSLVSKLFQEGHELYIVSRSRRKALEQIGFPVQILEGNLTEATIPNIPEDIEAVIHLMGEGVADQRWDEEQKKRLWDSRVKATQNLIASLKQAPAVFLSASAIGFYGDRGEEELHEESPVGNGFMPELCQAWEKALSALSDKTRVCVFRIGIVLARNGGALEQMLLPFRAGVGGPLGSGRQWMSWIHIQDLIGMMVWALQEEKARGVINAVSSEPVRNKEFSQILASVLQRWSLFPVPNFALRLILGEVSAVVLSSQRIVSRASSLGYNYHYKNLNGALLHLLESEAKGEDRLEVEQFIPYPLEKVFAFFCDARNLEEITPEYLNFRITSVRNQQGSPIESHQIGEGSLIDYKLKVRGLPVKWRTRIESWNMPHEFVDTQLKGPYQLWHHTHRFTAIRGGTLMKDTVRYKVPLGYLGWLFSLPIVKRDVQDIFAYRRKVISERLDQIFSASARSGNE